MQQSDTMSLPDQVMQPLHSIEIEEPHIVT
jgi:hypothetical protein